MRIALRWRPVATHLIAFFTSAPILASSAAVSPFSAKAVGHIWPSSRFASSLKPRVAYLVLNFCAFWKKQTTLPSLAYAGIPYQVFGERAGAWALTIAWIRSPMAIRLRQRSDFREHGAFPVPLVRTPAAARVRLQLLDALPHRDSFLVRESLRLLSSRGGVLGGLMSALLCRLHSIFIFYPAALHA